MASIQIPNLTAAVSVSGAEQMEAVQGGSSVRVTIQQIADLAGSQFGLTPIPDLTLLGNLSGVSALPTDYTLSQFLDSSFSNTQGAVLYRGASSWQALAPGANGQVLRTNGTGADVSWYTVPGGGTVQSITAGTNLSVSGSANPITLAGTINVVDNPTFTTSVTTPSIYGGSSASQTLLIQSTTGVGTSDSIVFKVGNNGAITAMTIASDGTVTIPQAAIDTTSITVPLVIGGTTASSTLTLESTSGAGTSDAIIFKTGSQVEAMRIRTDQNVSIGGTGAGTVSLYVQKDISGTTSYGIYSNGSFQSGVVSGYQFSSQSNVVAGATLTTLSNFRATEGTIAGTITNQIGFDAVSDLISATNNYGFRAQNTAAVTAGKTAYGFYSTVNTATGGGTTYGFYAAGTAKNVMPNLNGGTTASSSLTLQSTTGVGTTDSIVFKTGNNGAVTALTIASNGNATFLSTSTTAIGTLTLTNALGAIYGGTGQSTVTTGDLLYGSGTNTWGKLADVATGSILVSGGVGVAPAWSASPTLTTSLTVPVVYGGTGAASSLTLQSTSGVGTTDSIIFKVGNAGAVTALTIGTTGAATFGVSATSPYYIANGATTGSRNQGAYAYGTMSYSDTNVLLSLQSSVNSYNELVIQNTNSGTTASTNIIVSNDLGTASTYYGEFGINSSGFTGSGSLAGASNVYLTSTSADLAIGTTTSNAVRFVVNSGTTDAMLIRSDGNISIGSTGAVNVPLYLQKTITGSATSYGMISNGSVQNDVINAHNIQSQTYVASGTALSVYSHFRATEGTVSGTITNQYGFIAISDLISATNNYGFFGNIPAGTNRWNLMNNTAGNYVAGSLGIGTTTNVTGASPTTWLQIAAGTATVAPVTLTSGTNLTTATAGAIEYNGKTVLATPLGSERGIVTSPQYYVNNATRTGPAAVTTFVNILPANPSLSASTRYAFEIYFAITKTSANACTGAIGFSVTGTAPAALSYEIYSTTGAAQTTVAAASLMSNYITTGFGTAVVATAASAASANTYHTVLIKGTVDTGAGAITSFAPQFQYSTGAPTASTFQVGAYMYIYPLSATGAATSVGTWA